MYLMFHEDESGGFKKIATKALRKSLLNQPQAGDQHRPIVEYSSLAPEFKWAMD
jgi:hypothetical protein